MSIISAEMGNSSNIPKDGEIREATLEEVLNIAYQCNKLLSEENSDLKKEIAFLRTAFDYNEPFEEK